MTTRPRTAIGRTLQSLLLTSLVGTFAHAQDISSFSRTTNPLTSAQQETLEAFVSNGIRGLKSDSNETVMEARARMIEPLRRTGTSPVFRESFGKLFVQESRRMLEGSEVVPVFNYANVCQVLAFIRTGESNEFLASTLQPGIAPGPGSPRDEGRRLSAASMLAVSIRTTDPERIRPRQFNSIMRSVVMGAEQAESWAVLQREFETLESIASNPEVKEDIRKAAVENQIKVMEATTERIARGEELNLVRALSPMVLTLRSQYIRLEGSIRRTFNQEVENALRQILEAGASSWKPLHEQEELERIYGDTIEQATVLMRLINGGGNAPSGSDPAAAWRNGDESGYESAVKSWS